MSLSPPTSNRRLHVYESELDIQKLNDNKYNFHLAKSVVTEKGSGGTSNVIWQSLKTPPNADIKWVTEYALNWTAKLPDSGADVTIGGHWKPCKLGEVFDINENGMKVGRNKYQYPGEPPKNIRIVVGQKITTDNGEPKWQPIFVDPTELYIDGSATYQPQEQVKMWYETGLRTGQVYARAFETDNVIDYTKPASSTNKYEWWTTYTTSNGAWTNSTQSPEPYLLRVPGQVPAKDALTHDSDTNPNPEFRWVLLSQVVPQGQRDGAASFIQLELRVNWPQAIVKFAVNIGPVGMELKVTFGPDTIHSIGTLNKPDLDTDILKAVEKAVKAGKLPEGTTAEIEPYGIESPP
ncbi:hypothetical protein BKA66DRAFT_443913 [Pyrenochaeta sp. MPI-SDFR-AT-0127]|nr:hypothetical protein BKA66DRAFT_443913 [Pyrenochaeta sp. MPI-SDFR-AT-0127]